MPRVADTKQRLVNREKRGGGMLPPFLFLEHHPRVQVRVMPVYGDVNACQTDVKQMQ